jgi:hypothetical protein
MKTGLIIKVVLVEIRAVDYAQCYTDADGDFHWLTGWNKASNVKVGDRGVLIYESTNRYGLHFFHKEGCDCNYCRGHNEK